MKEFDVGKWVDDSFVRTAFAELKLDYDGQLKSLANYEVAGEDTFCKKPIADPRAAGEVWVDGEGIAPFSSAACTLGAYSSLKAKGKKINVAYVFDTARGIKLFADQAYYAVGSDKTAIAPFLLKKDAEAYAAKNGGRVLGFEDAVKAAISGG
jgi:NitT/TauT family transport system substrate-binding protein